MPAARIFTMPQVFDARYNGYSTDELFFVRAAKYNTVFSKHGR